MRGRPKPSLWLNLISATSNAGGSSYRSGTSVVVGREGNLPVDEPTTSETREPGRLGPGSIIEPGNWGRLLRRYENASTTNQLFGQVWILTRELVLELERERSFQDRPSRMMATFSFRTREHAEQYRAEHDKPRAQVLHRVELVEATALRHEASLAMLRWPAANTSFLDTMTTQAQAYWRGEGVGAREVLSFSALRVIESLE
jgi:Protein of unknown function (DUF2441)